MQLPDRDKEKRVLLNGSSAGNRSCVERTASFQQDRLATKLIDMYALRIVFVLLWSTAFARASGKVDHSLFDALLKTYVTPEGTVDYSGFKKAVQQLDAYLLRLKQHPPEKDWTDDEKKAFYINAYNAYTIKLVLLNYPVKSPKDIVFSGKTIWHFATVYIGVEVYTLQQLEDDLLRKMNDPRIHFAINCGAVSCPKLLNEAYVPERLEQQLTAAARRFVRSEYNELSAKKLRLSKIFEWYAADFQHGDHTVVSFLNQYAERVIDADALITYLPYNWSLNE